MCEAGNFQSNVDNQLMDFQDEVRFICHGLPDLECTFVQFYNTTPHFIDPEFVRHPVSRVISTCGLHEGIREIGYSREILLKAQRYVDIMSDLCRKRKCPSDIRIEGVFRFKGLFPEVVRPEEFFNENSFWMVPFRDGEEGFRCLMLCALCRSFSVRDWARSSKTAKSLC